MHRPSQKNEFLTRQNTKKAQQQQHEENENSPVKIDRVETDKEMIRGAGPGFG